MLWKCSVCGMILEGDTPPNNCPKCNSPSEKFSSLSEQDANKVYSSDRTNDIHMQLDVLCSKMISLCKEGISLNLDATCVEAFTKAKDEVWIIKQRSKAELETHMKKGKW